MSLDYEKKYLDPSHIGHERVEPHRSGEIPVNPTIPSIPNPPQPSQNPQNEPQKK